MLKTNSWLLPLVQAPCLLTALKRIFGDNLPQKDAVGPQISGDAVLDIENDKAIMFKQPIKLELTSSGCYCVNLRDESNPDERETQNYILIVTENMTTKEKIQVLAKLHKLFGNASVDRLKQLLAC